MHCTVVDDLPAGADKLAAYLHAPDPANRQIAAEGAEGIRRRRGAGRDILGARTALAERPRLSVHAERALGKPGRAPGR